MHFCVFLRNWKYLQFFLLGAICKLTLMKIEIDDVFDTVFSRIELCTLCTVNIKHVIAKKIREATTNRPPFNLISALRPT